MAPDCHTVKIHQCLFVKAHEQHQCLSHLVLNDLMLEYHMTIIHQSVRGSSEI